MEKILIGPLFRCSLTNESPIELVGESIHFTQDTQERVTIKLAPSDKYRQVQKFRVTSHRIMYRDGSELLALPLDVVDNIEVRGGIFKPKKVVLKVINGGSFLYFNVRSEGSKRTDVLDCVISEALRTRAWVRTEGFVPSARIGGITRVEAKLGVDADHQSELVDRGFVDLQSMKANAKSLEDLLDSLKRNTNEQAAGQVNALLREYGLCEVQGHAHEEGSGVLKDMVESVLTATSGVILIHDLFCLVNRRLRLEKIFSPKQFLEELKFVESIQVLQVFGYKIIVNLKLPDLNQKLIEHLQQHNKSSVSEITTVLKIGNHTVLSLLLRRIEEMYGDVVRDDKTGYGEEPDWYLNKFHIK